jgi:hypothetical protein
MPPFVPYSLPPFWNRPCTVMYGQGTPLDSSISEQIKALTNYVNKFQAIAKAHYLKLGDRLSLLKKDLSPIVNTEANESAHNMESDGEDAFSQVPRCQTGKFLIQ